MTIVCPQCKSKNPATVTHCRDCGTVLAATDAPGKKRRGGPSLFTLWLYRLGSLLLFLGLVASLTALLLARQDLGKARAELGRARATIEHMVTTGGEGAKRLRVLPPDGAPLLVELKLATCTVETITFEGRDATVRITNNSLEDTRPVVNVLLFDSDGQQIGGGKVVAFRRTSFAPGASETITEKLAIRGRPRFFSITD